MALRARHGRLFLLGVGGSADNCRHAVNDFRKLCGIEAYTPVDIVTTPSDDPRSYHINSDKIRRLLGYGPRRGIRDAVRDLCAAFKDGRLPDSFDDDRYYNVRTMKAIKAA